MNKIRILFTIPNLRTAGSKYVVRNILQGINTELFEPAVSILKPGGIEAEFEAAGIPVLTRPFVVEMRPRRTLLWRAWKAARCFQDMKIDIWHSWHYLDDYSEPLIAKLAGAKKWGYTKKNMSWGSRAWQLRSILADYIVADNPEMPKHFFSSACYRRKVLKVITHGVNIEQFHPYARKPAELRKSLGIPNNATLLACVAALVQVKDQETLLRAVAQIEPRPHLILVGEGDPPYKSLLLRTIKELELSEQVHFLGWQENDTLPSILNEADVFVLSSRSEAFGVVLIEAMACGLPCIATRSGGPENIVRHGLDGYLVSVGDSKQLSTYIEKLVNNPSLRHKMGRVARRNVVENFSIESEVKNYEKLYGEELWGHLTS